MRPRRAAASALRYLRELTGEAEYDRYCVRRLREDPRAELPTRREYERQRAARQEQAPHCRCC